MQDINQKNKYIDALKRVKFCNNTGPGSTFHDIVIILKIGENPL